MDLLPDSKTLLLFIVTSLTLLVVPGPAVLYVVARSLERGWRGGIVSALGLAGGAVIHIVLATLGVAALIQSSAAAFVGIRVAGAAFLVFLGLRTITGSGRARAGKASADVPLRKIFVQGLLVNLSNPKAILFFFAFLPQFIDPSRGSVAAQLLVLGGIFLVIAFVSDASWAILAGWVGGWSKRSPSIAIGQRYVSGIILILLGVIAAVSVL